MTDKMPEEIFVYRDKEVPSTGTWIDFDDGTAQDPATKYTRADIAGKWRSMETAPRDGTEILLIFSSGSVERAYWDIGENDEAPSFMRWDDSYDFVEKYIVGWLHMPESEEK